MNILFISQNYYPNEIGGYEMACRRLVELFQRKARVRVLASSFGVLDKERLQSVDYILDNVNNYGFDLKRRKVRSLFIRSYVSVRNYLITRRYVKKMAIDVVIAFQLDKATFTPLIACGNQGLPVIMDMGDLWWKTLCDQFKVSGWRRFVRRLSHGFFMPTNISFDRVICNSSYTAGEIGKVVAGELHTVHRHLPNFMFRHKLSAIKQLDIIRITYGGRLCEEKGVSNFINVIEMLCAIQPNKVVEARIIGDGNEAYVCFLRRLIEEKDLSCVIQMMPSVRQEEFFQHLCESHFFLFPFNWNEPFGQVVPQAMMAGAIPICSNHGGPATVIKNGVNGFLFNSQALEDFAKIIATLANDLKKYNRIRLEGHAYALSHFSPEKVADKYFALIESVVRKSEQNS